MDKIVHVVIACFYKEGMGYQENLLPAKHRQLGYDTVIVSYDRYGTYEKHGIEQFPYEYTNDRGVRTVILPKNHSLLAHLPIIGTYAYRTEGLYGFLKKEKPSIIFVHGIGSPDHREVVQYVKKNPAVKLFVDNHNDYYNAPMNSFWSKFFLYTLERPLTRLMSKYAEMMWGVTPWRVDFLIKVFGAPKDKVSLLVMGGDEDKIDWSNRDNIRKQVRRQYGIPEAAFLIITGGRIDKTKNIDQLIEAVLNLKNGEKLYLLVFGNPQQDMKDFFRNRWPSNIILAGWVDSDAVYPLFLASDLAVFPGTHSVLWEQACSAGIPCLFKDWNGGFSHVDVGGNCKFLTDVSENGLCEVIVELITNPEQLQKMREVAETIARPYFSYKEIAKRSILQ